MDEAKSFQLGGVDYITKPFTPHTVRARVKTHISLKAKTDMLEKLASVDGLTGLNNRRKFDEELVKEWKRTSRDEKPISLVLMDIDYFKPYNDNYGHANGDECLRCVADCLHHNIVRSGDILCRYGGEEFALILPGTDSEGAVIVAEKLRQSVFDLNLPHGRSTVSDRVTISVGTASSTPIHSDSTPEDLLKIADRMLYRAKEGGRNQVAAHKGAV